jgi:hypothetical protein
MQTILRILERAGGYRPTLYLNIENPPYMALVIEATPEPGPLGLPGLSVVHYGLQNGDPMRDPEMCFELSKPVLSQLQPEQQEQALGACFKEDWSNGGQKAKRVLLPYVIGLVRQSFEKQMGSPSDG